MKRELNLKSWNRKEHFEFFKTFDDPYFGITAPVDCTQIYNKSKAMKVSFNLCIFHHLLKCMNELEYFRYRIEDDKVFIYDQIHGGTTIGRENETFCFGNFAYFEDLTKFITAAQLEVNEKKALTGLQFNEETKRIDLIHYSALPWISFTSLKHASQFGKTAGVPKVSVGKFYKEGARIVIPVSLTAHHGLMDGVHAAQLFKNLERE